MSNMFWFVIILNIFIDVSLQQNATTTEAPSLIDDALNSISIAEASWFTLREDQIQFRLINRQTCVRYQLLKIGQLANISVINPKNQFKFIIHGYLSGPTAVWFQNMTKAFVREGDYNVVQVNWAEAAKSSYPIATRYTRSVANFTANLIADLNQTLGVSLSNIHLIGHSLGAHISGYAGSYVIKMLGGAISRISGLDPAGPLFLTAGPEDRLDPSDALFVDVIHTDGGRYGYYDTLGNVDFYPNGGIGPQPGCRGSNLFNDTFEGCSHGLSHEYYTESISSSDFVAKECQSYLSYMLRECQNRKFKTAIMGEHIERTSNGTFYLTVNAMPPYARNGTI